MIICIRNQRNYLRRDRMSKRKKTKFPALNKGVNTLARKDFIEVDYINGVRDAKGNIVIRAMTEAEKQWLNDFYEETVITNFLHHPELQRLHAEKRDIIECKYVKKMKEQIKSLKGAGPDHQDTVRELKQTIKLTKEQNRERNYRRIRKIESDMQKVRDSVLLYSNKEDHKQFYKENNDRNNCIYNTCKKRNILIDLDIDAIDSLMAKHLECIDYEDLVIGELEGDTSSEKDNKE